MALGSSNEKLKLVSPGILINESGKEVAIHFDKCEFCSTTFMGTEHNDPGQNPIELAVSYCGVCL